MMARTSIALFLSLSLALARNVEGSPFCELDTGSARPIDDGFETYIPALPDFRSGYYYYDKAAFDSKGDWEYAASNLEPCNTPNVCFEKTAGVVVIRNGATAWGRLLTASSTNPSKVLLALQGPMGITRTVSNLDVTKTYTLSLLAAERNDYHGNTEVLKVTIESAGVVIGKGQINPTPGFARYEVAFKPGKDGTAKITITNATPVPKKSSLPANAEISQTYGAAVFIDAVRLSATRDCGEGASCLELAPPQHGYQCECDLQGYVGHAVTMGTAVCRKISDGDPDDDIKQLVEDLTARVKQGEASQRTLVSQTAGLVKADEGASSRLDALEASVATLTAANKALTTTVTALQSDNTKLKADSADLAKLKGLAGLFKAAAVSDNTFPAPTTATLPRDTPAQIAAEGGVVDVVARELTLNGEHVASAEETKAMVAAAIADVLGSIADQL